MGCLQSSLQMQAWISLPLQPVLSCRQRGVRGIPPWLAQAPLAAEFSMNHGAEGNFLRCSVMPAKVNKDDAMMCCAGIPFWRWNSSGRIPLEGKVCAQQPRWFMETRTQLRASAAPPSQPQLGFSGWLLNVQTNLPEIRLPNREGKGTCCSEVFTMKWKKYTKSHFSI